MPAGVVGLVSTRDCPDLLCHSAVRARTSGVPFVTCFDGELAAQLAGWGALQPCSLGPLAGPPAVGLVGRLLCAVCWGGRAVLLASVAAAGSWSPTVVVLPLALCPPAGSRTCELRITGSDEVTIRPAQEGQAAQAQSAGKAQQQQKQQQALVMARHPWPGTYFVPAASFSADTVGAGAGAATLPPPGTRRVVWTACWACW